MGEAINPLSIMLWLESLLGELLNMYIVYAADFPPPPTPPSFELSAVLVQGLLRDALGMPWGRLVAPPASAIPCLAGPMPSFPWA